MFSKMSLIVAVAAFGFGCAGTTETMRPMTTQTAAPRREVKPLRPVGVAQAMKTPFTPARSEAATADRPAPNADAKDGVGLHGPAKTYVESFDPSGWGGPSTPRGGGPPAGDAAKTPEGTPQNPYEDDGLGDQK